jgi:hypothetical protein
MLGTAANILVLPNLILFCLSVEVFYRKSYVNMQVFGDLLDDLGISLL